MAIGSPSRRPKRHDKWLKAVPVRAEIAGCGKDMLIMHVVVHQLDRWSEKRVPLAKAPHSSRLLSGQLGSGHKVIRDRLELWPQVRVGRDGRELTYRYVCIGAQFKENPKENAHGILVAVKA
jgi:hypothetical protein